MERIMAIDLGKFKSVVCNYLAPSGAHDFVTIKTGPQVLHDLLVEQEPDVVVVEVCGIIGWVHDLVRGLDIAIKVANTNDERWRKRRIKRKTDRKDALKLARLTAMNELPEVYIPALAVREKRALINYRQSVSTRVTQVKNSIRSILERQALSLPSGKNGWSQKSLAYLWSLARPGRISKDGNGLVRSLLVEVCWLAQQWNPWVRQCYEQTARGSKTRKKIAIVAVGRRLLVRMWAMLRDGTAWRMPELK